MTTDQTRADVTITLTVNGATRTFTADGSTVGDPYNLAEGLLSGVASDARRWINDSQSAARAAAWEAGRLGVAPAARGPRMGGRR